MPRIVNPKGDSLSRIRLVFVVLATASASIALLISSGGAPAAASAAPAAPAATTGAATDVAQSSAAVAGAVNPNGTATSYYFQYGTTTSYGSNTPSTNAGAGTADVAASANLSGLASSTTYHYRVVAVSNAGTTDGIDHTFTTTTPPTVTTGSAARITHTWAGVSGTVNPRGQSTTYYFRYGTTAAYGLQSSPQNSGSGTVPVGVHADIYGLTADTTYHYQLVAQNAGGTSYGAVVGVQIGCFHGTSTCTGHVTMSHNGVVIGQRDYSIPADSGGFQNMVLTPTGKQMLGSNSTFHLLAVTVTATGTNGQKLSFVIHLARWVWH